MQSSSRPVAGEDVTAQRQPGERPRGPAPGATRDEVLAAATERYRRCEHIDIVSLAAELGVSRASIYRWFGPRDGLVGAVVVSQLRQLARQASDEAGGSGREHLLATFDRINRGLARSQPLRFLLRDGQIDALRLVASGAGPVQPASVALIAELIDAEVAAGRYQPPTDTQALAYAVVRLAEAFLFNDAVADLRGDIERLHEVQKALLGPG